MYMDGSKSVKGKLTGAAFVEENTEEGYYVSINKRCIVFTVQVLAIAKALQKWENTGQKKNIIICSDFKNEILAINNNSLNMYKNDYVIEARRRILEIQENMKKTILLIWMP